MSTLLCVLGQNYLHAFVWWSFILNLHAFIALFTYICRRREVLYCDALFEKTYATKQKKTKSHVFWIVKKSHVFLDFEKNVKNVKVMTCKVLETTQLLLSCKCKY